MDSTNFGMARLVFGVLSKRIRAAGFSFSAKTGDKFKAWDWSTNLDWMPNQSITFRMEYVERNASVPYFAGPGGVTSPTGLITTPVDPNGSWRPDLVQSERKIIFAVLFRI